ncbi:S-adenosylmethionine:tRNA ribosyltransferase-isomerase [Ekhidna lutea]|uniref:S-adenosylmethionine:tRNA ribosyltransferase-isomerase n=1 Tax=Ekhidna lutea TaxID=447679 RepID=A0A239K5B1_EKHLU|nr:S-adenosylmethionine:tRNA ribosyltransferase-isomerase [Ekhidna lutea]SNT13345.1 S-adenosylmethionine:tRNA ribosyltransferase-isomerase [Ekhidna lutea]
MDLKLDDFLYELPDDRIAKHPPETRGGSRLLVYKQGEISHHEFMNIPSLLPDESLLVFNDTKVIPARIILHKESGARIEVFLLEPLTPSKVHEEVMNTKKECSWKCMIGNAKKWKIGTSLHLEDLSLNAIRTAHDEVTFHWNNSLTFSDLLTEIGKIPLPPYIDREVEEFDQERYQTVYSRMKGAVAAPTAGLHFTNEIIETITKKRIKTDYLTLHVSAGTFQPIKNANIAEHPMHNEQIWVSRENVENLLLAKKVISVGTTSMRTLESLYWYGVKLKSGDSEFFIDKKDAYNLKPIEREEALQYVLEEMKRRNVERIGGQTEIFIYPGYKFQICDGLVTNYHLPGSTLILLVASFIGNDWKHVYDSALNNNYRFLSYGDSSLLLP